MKSEQQRAEAYVRRELPELMYKSKGCEIAFKSEERFGHGTVLMELKNGYQVWSLGFFVTVEKGDVKQIIGHPIELQHWLRVLGQDDIFALEVMSDDFIAHARWTSRRDAAAGGINFNLTTGQPATEADFAAFNQIVGNNI
jgi:hypothetical protein